MFLVSQKMPESLKSTKTAYLLHGIDQTVMEEAPSLVT